LTDTTSPSRLTPVCILLRVLGNELEASMKKTGFFLLSSESSVVNNVNQTMG
jgi:hypothetical protein